MTPTAARDVHPLSARAALLALAFFAAMAVLQTWPLAQHPATWSRHDNGDAMLNEWAIAWVAHQLPRDPLHLFDANIFHPERNTLAFSEHMLPQALMGAPLLWLGAPTLLVHNLLLLAGLALSGWTMSVVMFRWTGAWGPALVSGVLLAFNAHTLTRLTHLQAMHLEFLPLAIYALDRLLVRPRLRTALALAAAVTLQSLTSNYLLVATAFALPAATLARPGEWIGAAHRRAFGLLILAAAVAGACVLPFLLPYAWARAEQGLVRPLSWVSLYDASWADYLTTGGRFHFDAWSRAFWPASKAALFPGALATLLATVTLASGSAWRQPAVRAWLAVGLVGLLLSFGTKVPGYALLYEAVPLLQGIRATVRLGYLALVAIAALAGFGLTHLLTTWRMRGRLAGTAVTCAVLAIVSLEATRVPVGWVPKYIVPDIYQTLARADRGPVVELPIPSRSAFGKNAPYLLHSTVGWWPLVNGYSGFSPPRYETWHDELNDFPDDRSLAALREGGVRYVVVHLAAFVERDPDGLQHISRSEAIRPLASDGDIAIYRVEATTP